MQTRSFRLLRELTKLLDAGSKQREKRLPGDVADVVAAYAAKATWPAGFVVYQRGAHADGLFIVTRGRIVLRSRVKAGRAFVPALAREGETFGWEGLGTNARYATDARADEESDTLHLSTARFRELLREQPQHALALVAQMVCERTALLEKLRELATLSVEQRLISSLVRLAHARMFMTDDGRMALGPAQYRLLCELVGATRESVSLVLTRLVAEGLAERNGSTVFVAPVSALADRLDSNRLDGEMPIVVSTEMALEARD
ncbi:MAG: cyclic nucleotide-binding protein [Geminicoccaceae bacterium]|nr:cyclic nucleotide-binding protein [Geminicoccaceae bacterium]